MIAFAKPDDEEQPTDGGLGGSVRGIRDTRLIERALRERWAIPDELRGAIVARQVEIATDPGASPREATSAARCLVSMEAQNQADQHKVIDKIAPDQHAVHHTHEEIQAALSEARLDAAYVELERKRAIEAGVNAGLNGSNGKPRQVDSGAAPGAN